jgi:hypothetical protein
MGELQSFTAALPGIRVTSMLSRPLPGNCSVVRTEASLVAAYVPVPPEDLVPAPSTSACDVGGGASSVRRLQMSSSDVSEIAFSFNWWLRVESLSASVSFPDASTPVEFIGATFDDTCGRVVRFPFSAYSLGSAVATVTVDWRVQPDALLDSGTAAAVETRIAWVYRGEQSLLRVTEIVPGFMPVLSLTSARPGCTVGLPCEVQLTVASTCSGVSTPPSCLVVNARDATVDVAATMRDDFGGVLYLSRQPASIDVGRIPTVVTSSERVQVSVPACVGGGCAIDATAFMSTAGEDALGTVDVHAQLVYMECASYSGDDDDSDDDTAVDATRVSDVRVSITFDTTLPIVILATPPLLEGLASSIAVAPWNDYSGNVLKFDNCAFNVTVEVPGYWFDCKGNVVKSLAASMVCERTPMLGCVLVADSSGMCRAVVYRHLLVVVPTQLLPARVGCSRDTLWLRRRNQARRIVPDAQRCIVLQRGAEGRDVQDVVLRVDGAVGGGSIHQRP